MVMSNDIQQEEEKKEFDLYFETAVDDFELKLYYINPDSKRRKEYIETFSNTRPNDDYIAEIYGAGHFWCMGTDHKGKIKSKNIFISDMAVKRIKDKRYEAQTKLNGGQPPQGNNNGGGNGSIQETIGVLMPILEMAFKSKQPSQIEQFIPGMESISKMMFNNMEMVSTNALNHTKKLVTEKLADKPVDWREDIVGLFAPLIERTIERMMNGGTKANGNSNGAAQPQQPEKPSGPVPVDPNYTQTVVNNLMPHLESVLTLKGDKRDELVATIKNQKEWFVIISSQPQIDLFYEVLSTTAGVPKAKRVMDIFDFNDSDDDKTTPHEDVTENEKSVG